MSDNERLEQYTDMDTLEDEGTYFDELDLIASIEHQLQVEEEQNKIQYEHIASFI